MDTIEEGTCKDLAIWFLDQLPGKTNRDRGSFAKHVSIAGKLVGTKARKGKWTIKQVKRAYRVFCKETGKKPTHLGTLDSNWFAPDGSTWMEYANRPPDIPSLTNAIQLNEWLREWGHTLPEDRRHLLRGHVAKNMR